MQVKSLQRVKRCESMPDSSTMDKIIYKEEQDITVEMMTVEEVIV
jgi:hypothetical protein